MAVALKVNLITTDELEHLRKKFDHLKCTVSTYTTKYGTPVVLYIYWQGQEKAAQYHDYGYAKCLKDFVHKNYYTDYEQFANS